MRKLFFSLSIVLMFAAPMVIVPNATMASGDLSDLAESGEGAGSVSTDAKCMKAYSACIKKCKDTYDKGENIAKWKTCCKACLDKLKSCKGV